MDIFVGGRLRGCPLKVNVLIAVIPVSSRYTYGFLWFSAVVEQFYNRRLEQQEPQFELHN